MRSEEHTSELQSPCNLVCRLLLEKKKEATTAAGELVQHIHRTPEGGIPRVRVKPHPSLVSPAIPPVQLRQVSHYVFFFFNDAATTEICPLSLHDALPISTIRATCSGRESTLSPPSACWAT